jgi:hypothetical protein
MPIVTRVSFSANIVKAFPCAPGKKSSFLYDATAPGLGLRVSRGGTRCYFFEGRIDSHKSPIRITIGNINDWPLADAQKRARELRKLTDLGLDPRTVEADAAAPRLASVTFGEARKRYAGLQAPDEVMLKERLAAYVAFRKQWNAWELDESIQEMQGYVRSSQRPGTSPER